MRNTLIFVILLVFFGCKKSDWREVDDKYKEYVGTYIWKYSILQAGNITYTNYPPNESHYYFEITLNKRIIVHYEENEAVTSQEFKYLSVSDNHLSFSCIIYGIEHNTNISSDTYSDFFRVSGGPCLFDECIEQGQNSYFEKIE